MKQVKIGKKKYKIREKKINPKHYAEFDQYTQEILLQPGIRSYSKAKALYHEILHGIVAEYIPEFLTQDEEEKVVRAIEKGWIEFTEHNPAQSLMLQARLSLRK